MTLRLCVGQTNTQARHVKKAWKRIREEAGNICDPAGKEA
jgi:hypothetical protein